MDYNKLIDFYKKKYPNKENIYYVNLVNNIYLQKNKKLITNFTLDKTPILEIKPKDYTEFNNLILNDIYNNTHFNEVKGYNITYTDFTNLTSIQEKIEYFFIDSKFRNKTEYSNQNNYKIFFDSKIKKIKNIKLCSVEVPNIEYIINEKNNSFSFQETLSTILNFNIPIGNYSLNSLINIIQNNLNFYGNSNYNVIILNNKLKITSDLSGGFFQLHFDIINSSYFILGFIKKTYDNLNNYISDYEVNIIRQKNSMYLNFPNVKNTNNSLKYLISGTNEIIFYKNKNQESIMDFYIDLDYLEILWTDKDNNLINFYNHDHSFVICITYMEYQIPELLTI